MTPPSAARSGARERNPIASMVRVLDAMVESEASTFGVRELARALDAPPSSIQRTLEAGAVLSLVNATSSGQWELGWGLYRIASLAQRKRPFQAVAELLTALSEHTGETAFFSVYDGQRRERMYVAASPCQRSVQFVPQLFTWLPLHATASVMAIVAHLPQADREKLYALGLPLYAGRRPAVSTIERTVTAIRFDGFALSRDQADVGASAIAAPVWSTGTVAGSVGVAVPNQRFIESSHGALAGHVVQTAEIISRRLGDPLSAVDGPHRRNGSPLL